MTRPIVLIAEELSPATIDALGSAVEVRHVDGTDRAALLAALKDASALLVRSATRVDAEALRAAPNLRVVARAGVGLDNVDLDAATAAGVMVVNAPTSNIVSAAELAITHLLGLARHLPEAHASLIGGAWQRSRFTGVELFEKTVGIVGLGRIGALVAERLAPFAVRLIGYDPYITPARAAQIGVEPKTLEEVMAEADFITIHIPKTPETTGLIGDAEFALAKPELRIVNCSRGGIIDEDALARALDSGRIAGAALDVFTSEPPTNDALLAARGLQVTPHLGASTSEAQEKAGIAVARSTRLALAGDLVPDAVNVRGAVDEVVRPGLPLTEKLGRILGALAGKPLASVEVVVAGELAEHPVDVLVLAALKGLLTGVVSEQVTYVNAPGIAKERGIASSLATGGGNDDYRNAITVRGVTTEGETRTVTGTLTGQKQVQKLIEVDGFELEVPIGRHLLVMRYADRPGVVALYGRALGEAGINIEGMQIAANERAGEALAVLRLGSSPEQTVLDALRDEIGASQFSLVELAE